MGVSDWTSEEVGKWLNDNNFKEYITLFCEEHRIDGLALLNLTEQDLREPPLEVNVLGDIKRLGLAIRKLQFENGDDLSAYGFNVAKNCVVEGIHISQNSSYISASSDFSNSLNKRAHHRLDSSGTEYSTFSDEEDHASITSHEELNDVTNIGSKNNLPREYIKLSLSILYMTTALLTTAFVMVIVNDRVPDMDTYPPLPDLILDNLPYIPWAFQLCEITAVCLMTVLSIALFLHRHR